MIEKSSRCREMELSVSIITFIDENISNPMLNLSSVAAAFGLSERYTQKLILNQRRKISLNMWIRNA
jgi:AraC-like DNA-binding protein